MSKFRNVSRKFISPIHRSKSVLVGLVGAGAAAPAVAQTTVTDIGLDIPGLLTAYAGEAGTLLMAVLGIGLAIWVAIMIVRKLKQHAR